MNHDIHVDFEDGSFRDRSPMPQRVQEFQGKHVTGGSARPIAIASTFTADLIRQPLKFWMETLDIAVDIEMAPYAQVMQELLSPKSVLSQNKRGFNVLLIRLEDWIRDRLEEDVEKNLEHILRVANDFVAAMGVLRARTSAATLLFLCPSSSSLPITYSQLIEEEQRDLATRLGALEGVRCWTHADLVRLYPIIAHEDARADRIGHIPYTSEYFVAIATLLARHITAILKPKYKVIAVDCDNTLWKGVCGEDGAAGVELTPAHREFQDILVRQHDEGMLLCLCSKNNASDVEAVFRAHPEMPLREEHLVSSRVNWSPKSSNLLSLSKELRLSLESFILVDDSSLECAEVQAHCPSVLTLQFPVTPEGIAHFLRHVWAFDRIGVTAEAKQRTVQYKQNRARDQALDQAINTEQFLASLELKAEVSVVQAGQLARVAELIQRTNQFNLTSIRRGFGDIEAVWTSGDLHIRVVHVRDRFGDYGLVGALFFRCDASSLDVDTFVLSCRVLGRGVEHRILNELGRIARQERLSNIVLRYRKTSRNAPAWAFLEESFGQFRAQSKVNGGSAAESVFTIPVAYAETLGTRSVHGKVIKDDVTRIADSEPPVGSTKWHESAYRLSVLSNIVQEINRSTSGRCGGHSEYVAPRTPTEEAVAEIWREVLGLEKVSVREDFLDLGGDSLLAVQAIARIGSVLGLELSITNFFEAPTVEEVARKLASASQSGLEIQRTDRARPVPLSLAQQRLWFIDQLEGGSAAYHIPLAIRLRGQLDGEALQAALDSLVERHEALRTVFIKVKGEPVQEIALDARLALQLVDLRALATEEREAEVLRQSREELVEAFDLTAGPLIRGRLLQLSQDEHVLLTTMHHIISDGWSMGVLIRELGVLYEAYREGRPDPLPPLPIQYADYAQWQRKWLAGTEPQEQLKYWKEHLQGAPELLELPTDRPRPAVQSYRGASAYFSIESDLAADLKILSRRFNLTLAMTLYTAWSIVLSRLSEQKDIVMGMPVANRRRTELEGLIGFFVNTLALRVKLGDDPRVTDLLLRVKEIMLAAYTHQDAPFEQVVEALQPARSLSHNPIFQVMFAFQNAPRGALQLYGLTLVEQEVPLHTAQFDLLLSLQESADEISGCLNYASDIFDAGTIRRWVECLKTVLSGIVRQSHLPVSRLPLMGEDERREVVELFNATQTAYPQEKLIHELFEAQVERTPDAIAVVYERQSLTYAELNGKANQLARYLRTKRIGADQLVGICVERSTEMVVGLLGILKAGGGYVPLDPNYPSERLQFMLEDAAPHVVLTQEALSAMLPAAQAEVIALDAKWKEIAGYAEENLSAAELELTSQNRVYVIYTSGSTGQPKGTAMAHRSMVNLIEWHRKSFLANEGKRVLQFAALSFDVAFQETFTTLCTGGTLVLLDEWVRRDARALAELLSSQSIQRLFVPPLMLQNLAETSKSAGSVPGSLQDVITAGEQLRISPEMSSFFKQLNGCRLHNHYGPTESHVVTTLTLTGDPAQWPVLPAIGKPIANTQIYVLDGYLQPAPICVAGEIYIGGANVARGYLNRPELTAQRFIADPFSADPQARLYNTGDRGRWQADGTLEYLGRNDDQVKIRGYRIELGEIEAQLARHEQVKEAAVVVREDVAGERRLVAYVTRRDAGRSNVEELRAHLKAALPKHMVPSAFVTLECLPLTPSGKLDRRALPVPKVGAYARQDYEAPRGEIEEAVAGIWQQLLRVERIGRQDNFFDLGGHSLLATRVITHISHVVDVEIPLRVLFEQPTIEALSNCIVQEIAAELSMEAL